ncbi:MAG: hypothetical protein HYS17_08070 [Micavibrio aeruginosavorus]|uniref:Uncharacterized protein n=1 Tax=Micavibrio aeruginosavorus TaxID=349221 RepID=A0A7T5R0Z2_9BACT|nr:MAG: hypothetical protein HYS17_08070 [Micavibrio aeruginosavorus]
MDKQLTSRQIYLLIIAMPFLVGILDVSLVNGSSLFSKFIHPIFAFSEVANNIAIFFYFFGPSLLLASKLPLQTSKQKWLILLLFIVLIPIVAVFYIVIAMIIGNFYP